MALVNPLLFGAVLKSFVPQLVRALLSLGQVSRLARPASRSPIVRYEGRFFVALRGRLVEGMRG